MREILFKAKRKNWRDRPKDEWWVEGDLTHEAYGICIQYRKECGSMRVKVVIDPDTLCQYIGHHDINNRPIFEHDIFRHGRLGIFGEVVWCNEADEYIGWGIMEYSNDGMQLYTPEMFSEIEVIGNSFDDMEQLEKEKNDGPPVMTVKEWMETRPDIKGMELMTPEGYVSLKREDFAAILNGKSVKAHLGSPGTDYSVAPEIFLNDDITSYYFKDGVLYGIT